MSYTLPSDANVPGNAGHTSDHNNIADVLNGNNMILFNAQNTAYAGGAKGNGTADDTLPLQAALNAAGAAGAAVFIPPVATCYRTSGLTVPAGVAGIYGSSMLFRSDETTTGSLNGSVLAPINGSVTALLAVGTSGSGSVVTTNPHGLVIDGIGFLGTTAAGASISGMWGAVVTDTSDVTFTQCRDLFCDAPSFSGYPSGGAGTGGAYEVLSSGSGNGFSENARFLFCGSYGAGKFILADGTTGGAGGSTDGRIIGCQANGHNRGVSLGLVNAGTGGWGIVECHFSSTSGLNHINYGSAGTPWTVRIEACYFDVVSTNHLLINGRGAQIEGCYFRTGASMTVPVKFGSGLSTNGRDPAGVVVGNVLDLNGSTTPTCLAEFAGFTAANMASHGGGQYNDNLCHNHGAAMPGSWVAPFIGSDSAAVSATSGATLNLVQGPVLSA